MSSGLTSAPTERKEYRIRDNGGTVGADYTSQETLALTPLPCWKALSPEQYRTRIESLIEEIIREAEEARAQTGVAPLGADAVRHQNPETRPKKMKKSPAPRFHTFRKKVRRQMYEAYAIFVAAFREAADWLRAGTKTYRFPVGSFPPGLPFVTEEAEATAA